MDQVKDQRNYTFLCFLFCFLFSTGKAIDNGVGLTPPMGWNSWNHFHCDISEDLIKKTADKIVELGLDKKGYQYINLDDCWQISRNHETGQIIQDKDKFPSGMGQLAKYIHGKGLKFGLYSDAGYMTCEKRPGSLGYQQIDANTYANWGVDYLKYDDCYPSQQLEFLRYYKMHRALNNTKRPIFFSMCNAGSNSFPATWGNLVGNSWRTYNDIQDKWESLIKILDQQQGLQFYSGPGGWNDPDMLEVGNGGMKVNEYQAHFVLWCALKAPLLIGTDLNTISQENLNILGNQEMIAVNQDKLGVQARRIKRVTAGDQILDIYGGPLANNHYIVIFFNRGEINTGSQISLKKQLQLRYTSYMQRDPLRHQNIKQSTEDILKISIIAGHSVQVRILELKNNQILSAIQHSNNLLSLQQSIN